MDRVITEILKTQKEKSTDAYRKLYKVKGHRTKGQIISWAYFDDLGCYGVKREFGIEYFKHPCDFKTLPYFAMWLLNLSEEDIYILYKIEVFFELNDMDQALQFIRVIRLCFAYEIHASVNWKDKMKKFEKEL